MRAGGGASSGEGGAHGRGGTPASYHSSPASAATRPACCAAGGGGSPTGHSPCPAWSSGSSAHSGNSTCGSSGCSHHVSVLWGSLCGPGKGLLISCLLLYRPCSRHEAGPAELFCAVPLQGWWEPV